ncbi:MAG: bile acid transporter [Verrucomicrobiota bacterium]|nr:bile acid transporter [Verrucomicrobiota bacterium]MCC6821986.1 bile acid transporter [Limisphaerales bacterium]
MKTETIIRILTISALAGLLGAVGLRLTLGQVTAALRKCRFVPILLVNFLIVPALSVAGARIFGLGRETAIAMILLAAAPFAPVVPVFARMAQADLALAAGLTSVFPVLSAFLTPIICEIALKAVPDAGAIRFNLFGVLLTLVATITLPLAMGMLIHHRRPTLGQRLLRPVEVISEAVGALSLAFVTITEFGAILQTGWQSLLAMALVAELSLGLGYWLGGGLDGSRQVVALGTSNRNIALALLVAVQTFPGTPVMSAVVANGLLLILLGLLHVAWWRFVSRRR